MMKEKRQNILFSATMTDEVDEMIEEYFDFPEEVSLAPSGTPLDKIKQGVCKAPNFLTKINVLKHWLSQPELEKVLVFVNNKKIADLVYDALLEDGFENTVEVMHSNKSQNYRLQAIQAFQNNQIRIMVTTDVMARGLDITDITHVINLEVPLIPEQYIHRIGRTGRAQKEGDAWTMVSKKEEDAWLEIEVLMETEVPEILMPEVEISEK
jgi:ATP-dependent RNA helicase RhlE